MMTLFPFNNYNNYNPTELLFSSLPPQTKKIGIFTEKKGEKTHSSMLYYFFLRVFSVAFMVSKHGICLKYCVFFMYHMFCNYNILDFMGYYILKAEACEIYRRAGGAIDGIKGSKKVHS